jgi:hypothetical protein
VLSIDGIGTLVKVIKVREKTMLNSFIQENRSIEVECFSMVESRHRNISLNFKTADNDGSESGESKI